MDGATVANIAALVKQPHELQGFIVRPNDWTVEDPAALVKAAPTAKTLAVSTLGAVRDYLAANRDGLDLSKLVVHVTSPASVSILGPLDARARVRELFVTATAADLTTGFLGKFMSLEEFILGLQVRFCDADDRKRVLALLSNVKNENVKIAADDGITQVIQSKAGAVLAVEQNIPNPILLSAYRSFRDIAQPASFYVLRVQNGQPGGLPTVGLFEGDGGAWQLTTIARVREWLADALPQTVSVLA